MADLGSKTTIVFPVQAPALIGILVLFLSVACSTVEVGDTPTGGTEAEVGTVGDASKMQPAGPEELVRFDGNVLLVTIDTLRADYLSCYGNKVVSTPNIDALAERGVLFEQAVVQVPLTLPSHASILTGAYPRVHGVRDIGGFVLDQRIPTIASIASDAGMETGAFVGAAVLDNRFQLARGFDTYVDDMTAPSEDEKLPGVIAEVRAKLVSDRAIEWLRGRLKAGVGKEPGQRFFMWAHYYDPHRPFDPPEPYKSRYRDDLYAGESAYTDAEVGRLLDFLKEQGLEDSTLVVLLSDHGESLGEHGEFTHGVFLYDSTMHVPMIMAGPRVKPGQRVKQQVRSIDVMPTIASYLGLSAGDQVQGSSLLPLLLEGRPVDLDVAFMETLYPNTHLGWAELRGVRTDQWKLVVAPKPELYDLKQDPKEASNLIKQYPEEAAKLEEEVWEISGKPGEQDELDYQPLDPARAAQLRALGYVSAGVRREIRLDMSGPDPKDRVRSLAVLEDAGEDMNQNRFTEAATKLEELLPTDQTNPLIYQHLALCYTRLGQYRKSLQIHEQAIVYAVETDETFAEMGEIYIRLGDMSRAVVAMEKSADRNPTNLQNLMNLATVYLQLGELGESDRVLRSVLTQDEEHALAYNLMGILEIQKGNTGRARQHLEKAVQFDPELTEPYMNLGIMAQEAGEIDQAIGYFKEFLKRASREEHAAVIPQVEAAVAELERSR
ncbi:MAG: sulfatase-like hydrolase/transferase [Acidobacteriota bacterium]|nr:MAG: sulfatase-like hydrolase/transferase [Acidobacteriota bacterium]